VGLQRTHVGHERVDELARRTDDLPARIALHIESLVPQGRVRCLNVGRDASSLAEAVHELVARTDWATFDVRDDTLWSHPAAFDGQTIPHGTGQFDVAVLCDVLRHEPDDAARLLAEAGRVAQHVLVKDRFADSQPSRSNVRLMKRVGWSGRAGIAKGHFTREEFVQLAAEQHFFITALDCELSVVDPPAFVRTGLKPQRQFIAVLSRG
jgi:hypothetical protein